MSVDVTIIPDDYDSLRIEYISVKKELEIVKQDLHGAKRQIHTLEAVQIDYQNDAELIQQIQKTDKGILERKIAQLEEMNKISKAQYVEHIQCLENTKLKFEEENEGLRAEIDFLKKSKVSVGHHESTIKLIDELTSVKEENILLQTDLEEMKISVESLQKINMKLEETVLEYKQEINDLKESFSCKRAELLEANNLIQKLNEEIICLKTELETYKNQPLDKSSKGNSLFAEVDDRRVYLQKTINNMKADFLTMKQERAKYLNEIRNLKLENKKLLQQWKEDSDEKEDDQYTVLKLYKEKIRVLEELLEKYQKDLEEKPVMWSTGSFEELALYNFMLETKKKEVQDLRQQLASRTTTETLLSTALKEANEKKRRYKLEASLKQKELEILTDKMKETIEPEKLEMQEPQEVCLVSDRKETCYRANDSENNQSSLRINLGNKQLDSKNSVRLHGTSKKMEFNNYIKKEPSPNQIETDNKIENQNVLQKLDENCSIKKEMTSPIIKENSPVKEDNGLIKDKENHLIKVEKRSINEEENIKITNLPSEGKKEYRSDVLEAKSEGELGKKVTFSNTTLSPKRTNSRRCTTVTVCKPMHFNNFSKPK